MPNLVDIVEVAEALESKAVYTASERCVAVRNRHASCRKCVDVCIVDAITVQNNHLDIDAHACMACGACTVVCPTEALIPLDPLDDDLISSLAQTIAATGGVALITCARMAARRVGDPEKSTVVPCLARIDESVVLQLIARGITDITLVDGTCSTCKYHACELSIDATLSSVQVLLAAQGSAVTIGRSSAFPAIGLAADSHSSYAAARRGFFTQAGTVAKNAAEKTVVTALKNGKNEKPPTLRERLRMSDTGALPHFDARRRMLILDALDALGESVVPQLETRLFGSVDIDTQACNACGMCTVFCPTGALIKSDVAPQDGIGSFLEFSLAECVQCNLCADACLKKCLTVSSLISTAELFDFEPRLIHIPNPPLRPGILSTLPR